MATGTAQRGRGRPPGDSGTREAIIGQARRQFGELGYRRTTLRGVARGAGVDPRLVLHYFGSKQALFLASVELPMQPEQVMHNVFADGTDAVAANAARLMVGILEDPGGRRAMLGLIRAAVSEPEAAELLRELITERLLLPIAERLGGDNPRLRASMVASQLVGLAVVRHVVGIQPLAGASRQQLIAALVPVFEHYFGGEWVEE